MSAGCKALGTCGSTDHYNTVNDKRLINSKKLQLEYIQQGFKLFQRELRIYAPKAEGSLNNSQGYRYQIVIVKSEEMNKDVTTNIIEELLTMQNSVQTTAKSLKDITNGFEGILKLEIESIDKEIVELNHIIESYLKRHREILFSQKIFS